MSHEIFGSGIFPLRYFNARVRQILPNTWSQVVFSRGGAI